MKEGGSSEKEAGEVWKNRNESTKVAGMNRSDLSRKLTTDLRKKEMCVKETNERTMLAQVGQLVKSFQAEKSFF